MCLAFAKNQKPIRKVATKNIAIYKLAIMYGNKMTTMFMETPIELGIIYRSTLDVPTTKKDGDNKCFLSDIDKGILPESYDCVFVSKGLHAFKCKKSFMVDHIDELKTHDTVLLKGYIPVGAEYYYNQKTGLIVSDSMVYKKIVNRISIGNGEYYNMPKI